MTAVNGSLVVGSLTYGGIPRAQTFLGSYVPDTSAVDQHPPTFAGVVSVDTLMLTSAKLHWLAGSDDITSTANLIYAVRYGTTVTAATTGSELVCSTPGATSVIVPGLTPGTLYYFGVRARDGAGNEDSNILTVSATTLAPDTTPPTFAGIATLDGATPTSLTASWVAATDAVTPQNAITYDLCWATSSGACTGSNFTTMASSIPGGLSLTIPGLAPGMTYYACVRARDQAGNEDANNVTASSSTTPVDATPPVVTPVSPAPGTPLQPNGAVVVDVTDDRGLTDAVLIAQFAATWEVVYDAGFSPSYRGSSATAISGGLRFTVVRVGGWPSTLTLKVRARDAAGNEA